MIDYYRDIDGVVFIIRLREYDIVLGIISNDRGKDQDKAMKAIDEIKRNLTNASTPNAAKSAASG